MQARRHGGHFGAVTLKRARIVPKRNQQDRHHCGAFVIDLFVLFLVFTPECEDKIRTKEGFCAPKQKLCPKRKQQDRCHWGVFSKKTFVLFFGLPPEYEGKIRVKGGFCAPKTKIVPQKKAAGPTPLRRICDKDLFLVSSPNTFFLPHQNFLCPPPP